MTNEIMLWKDLPTLEEHFMEAAEGNPESRALLAAAMDSAAAESFPTWPVKVRNSWQSGLDLVLEIFDRANLSDAELDFVGRAMRVGLDTQCLRDQVAALVRRQFADYMDPAGMIAALGIHDQDSDMVTISRRLKLFSELKEGSRCWISGRGVLTVVEIDGIFNEVRFDSDRPLEMALDTALNTVGLVLPDSALAKLLDKTLAWDALAASSDAADRLRQSLVMASTNQEEVLMAILGGQIAEEEAVKTCLAGKGPLVAVAEEETGRRWGEARSITELTELLRDMKELECLEGDVENLSRIWAMAAGRTDHGENFCQSVALLWKLASKSEWLPEAMRQVEPENIYWHDRELFAWVCDRMPGRLQPFWYAATLDTVGQERMASMVTQLPLRLWTGVERVLANVEGAVETLVRAVLTEIDGGHIRSDGLMWLWKSGRDERDVLTDHQLIFKTLAKPVAGSFLKAHHDLKKCLLEEKDFQRFIVKDGDENAIASLVRCTRGMPLLSNGEQQSLLVRLVRLYPHARALVEKKSKKVTRKALPKLTSMRSYEIRRQELEEIINVKIPANSRAIAHARSYGDLRENAEYKAAKEEQSLLGARRGELEEALHEIRGTDFGDVGQPITVTPGCSVLLRQEDGEQRLMHVLGLWDSNPEHNMISYDAPLGRLLIGCSQGATLSMPSGVEATVAEIKALSPEMLDWLRGEDL